MKHSSVSPLSARINRSETLKTRLEAVVQNPERPAYGCKAAEMTLAGAQQMLANRIAERERNKP